MPRADLDRHFNRIEQLVSEIRQHVPVDRIDAGQLRADLAGLLVVSIAASYETCVKETLFNYANKHHAAFGNFTFNNFKKLNSRISIPDLYKYTETFDSDVNIRFKSLISKRRKNIDKKIGKNIESNYTQILNWRHAFAHAWARNTTIEEAIVTHRLAKRVLYSFDEAFNGR
ncbi:HEPN domain-containing protein [Kaistia dalseonensis]|uniref:RiboL-PSP-HEPN domain-containing protein n=1 Tax=Kaistia dalseonensis TaxID=410840 RepID=A0ABU0HDH4_9HYPH|nr:HEPN domain-containing protein [Kaistia dalseonensis]MCX5497733.1 HEPN domain-containing protein [Kaistia dalseonensis]MDQ0440377.1 hypothetical protein [Kaistia dalseonensis]